VVDSWLHEPVCRKRTEMFANVCYMKLCVDREVNLSESWFHEAVCRHLPELWLTVGYMKLCVARDLNCG